MKQRLGVAMAISSFPKLLILDEPTNGLDPAGMEEMRELIKILPKEYGITVMISSHILDEVEKMVTSIGIINKGHMILREVWLNLKGIVIQVFALKHLIHKRPLDFCREKNPEFKEEGILLTDLSDVEIARCAEKIIDSGIDLYRMEERTKSLEQLFIQLTGKKNL